MGTTHHEHDVEAIAHGLFQLGASFDAYTSQMRRAFAINAHERLALAALWSRGPMTMTELGAWIPLSRAAVTTLVDRLELAGLVMRGGDGLDRRRTVVSVTDAALDRMRPVIAPWGEELVAIMARRDPDQWAIISSFLDDFRQMNEGQAAKLAALDDEHMQSLARVNASPGR